MSLHRDAAWHQRLIPRADSQADDLLVLVRCLLCPNTTSSVNSGSLALSVFLPDTADIKHPELQAEQLPGCDGSLNLYLLLPCAAKWFQSRDNATTTQRFKTENRDRECIMKYIYSNSILRFKYFPVLLYFLSTTTWRQILFTHLHLFDFSYYYCKKYCNH